MPCAIRASTSRSTASTAISARHRLMLALEEWERFELFLGLSAFRAGNAFGMEQGTWSYGGFVAATYAF